MSLASERADVMARPGYDETWVCIGSGPSLKTTDIDLCRRQGWHLATCNSTFRLVPDAEVFCAGDTRWWDRFGGEAMKTLSRRCEIWSGSHKAAHDWNVNLLRFQSERGFCTLPGTVCSGGPTGYYLIQIVGWRRPARIILLGYDMQHTDGRRHHHDDYPTEWANNAPNPSRWDRPFETLAWRSTVPIVNASRETSLIHFQQVALEELV